MEGVIQNNVGAVDSRLKRSLQSDYPPDNEDLPRNFRPEPLHSYHETSGKLPKGS